MFNRVNGNLALSRALGDYIFKKNDQKKLDEQIVIGKSDLQNAINLGNIHGVKIYATVIFYLPVSECMAVSLCSLTKFQTIPIVLLPL